MMRIFALLALCAPLCAQETPSLDNSTEAILDRLEAAVTSRKPAAIVKSLEAATPIDDVRVLKATALALRESNIGVKSACIETLRFSPNRRSLARLHQLFAKGDTFTKNDDLYAQLLRATAHKGKESSLEHLIQNAFKLDSDQVLRARVLGLGNLPPKAAIQPLIEGLETVGERQRLLHMDDFRTALVRLTGADFGMDAEAWIGWWEEKSQEPLTPRPAVALPAALAGEWKAYWSTRTTLPLETPKVKRTPLPQFTEEEGAEVSPAEKRAMAAKSGDRQKSATEAAAKKPQTTPKRSATQAPEKKAPNAKSGGRAKQGGANKGKPKGKNQPKAKAGGAAAKKGGAQKAGKNKGKSKGKPKGKGKP